MTKKALLGITLAAVLTACATIPPTPDTTVYLVRHAEKEDGTDPGLTPEGAARAARLAHRLRDAGLTDIWSTDTRRTKDTAAPAATETGLSIALYDPRNLPAFAEQLAADEGVHLVIGHSNTTPALVSLIGSDPEPAPMDELTEYDRLYTIKIYRTRTETTLERY